MLPTLDEAEGLEEILPRIPLGKLSQLGYETTVLVIDGGSTDETISIARRNGCQVLHQQ